ncbi:MAG: hypothetical protein KGS47_15115, partial [Chloroflexi bacterium]|nr:hypothetical protein [Chloroflexota bacterium]
MLPIPSDRVGRRVVAWRGRRAAAATIAYGCSWCNAAAAAASADRPGRSAGNPARHPRRAAASDLPYNARHGRSTNANRRRTGGDHRVHRRAGAGRTDRSARRPARLACCRACRQWRPRRRAALGPGRAAPSRPGARGHRLAVLKGKPVQIQSVLVANRGEIALRVMRACRELGIRSVAVYSDADRDALHTAYADEAYHLGPAPARDSYLAIGRLLDVARRAGVDAIHPGYGFLAEHAGFAQAVHDAGLIFIGPTPAVMRRMGGKVAARREAAAAGVPIVPGTLAPLDDAEAARRIAQQLGFPVAIKAVAGGGGRGFRVVHDDAEFMRALDAAQREAASSFGDSAVYLETYLSDPRHIEIQVLADAYGAVVQLGERECSVQRRHQKLIEESPSPGI